MVYEMSSRTYTAYILMAYVPGPTVEAIWTQLEAAQRAQIYKQVCDAVRELHSIAMVLPGPFREMHESAAISRGPIFT